MGDSYKQEVNKFLLEVGSLNWQNMFEKKRKKTTVAIEQSYFPYKMWRPKKSAEFPELKLWALIYQQINFTSFYSENFEQLCIKLLLF